MDYNNFENETFLYPPETVEGSNFTNCTFGGCGDTTFIKCNLYECTFLEPTHFLQSNIHYSPGLELPEGCELVLSNYTLIEDDETEDELNGTY